MILLLTTVSVQGQTEENAHRAFLSSAKFIIAHISETEKAKIAYGLLQTILNAISIQYGCGLLGFLFGNLSEARYVGDTDRDEFGGYIQYLTWRQLLNERVQQFRLNAGVPTLV